MNLPVPSAFYRVRIRFAFVLLAVLALTWSAAPVYAAAPTRSEQRAFNAAQKRFQDGLMPQAEREFAEFLTRYPESELRAEGVFRLGQIRFKLGNYRDALSSMKVEEGRAGALADRYRFLAGECLLALNNSREAAEVFAGLLTAFPDSALRLDAIYRQAVALGRLEDWSSVTRLLLAPDSEFSKARAGRAGEPTVVSGVLLAAEASMELRDIKTVSSLLSSLPTTGLGTIDQWRADLLRAKVGVAENRPTDAVNSASNLVAVARRLGSSEALAQSLIFQSDLLRQAGQLPLANAALEEVLTSSSEQAQRRAALSRIIELTLNQGRIDQALARLNRFLASTNVEPASDAARVALAEIQTRQAYLVAVTNAAEATALRAAALTNLQAALSPDLPLPLIGRSKLTWGWVSWADGDYSGAASNFDGAVKLLTSGRDAAVAAFKLGDSFMALQRWAEALPAYSIVVEQFGANPEVRTNLLDHANYQILRAAVAAGQIAPAEAAFQRLSQGFPNSLYAERGALLLGQVQTRSGRLIEARETLSAFAKQFANSKLNDLAELLAARTFEKQRDWPSATAALSKWVSKYPESSLRPTAELLLAESATRSAGETNAVPYFTNLIARFPSSREAPLAQNWIANHYWSRRLYADALKQFQLLYQSTNCPADLANEARLMAGKSAFALQEFRDARSQFTELINLINRLPRDTNNPPVLLGQAYFGLGETIFEQFLTSTNKLLTDFSEAVAALSVVAQDFAINPIGPAAWGRLGELHLQWGKLKSDPKGFDAATNAFAMAMNSPSSDAKTRSLAKFRLGETFEAQGQMQAALDAYLSVVYGDTEKAVEPLALQLAGIAAGRILEGQSKPTEASRVYARLVELEPALKPVVEKRQDALRGRFTPP